MNYIEALQNPHFKIIWEKIIMNRHPGVKSLEEALDLESHTRGCLIGTITSPHSPQHSKKEVAEILWDESIDVANNERWYCFKDSEIEPRTFTVVKSKVKILGRTITVEDVLMLFNQLHREGNGCLIRDTYISQYYDCIVITICHGDEDDVVITLEFVKFLHEQAPETWEQIAKLISN